MTTRPAAGGGRWVSVDPERLAGWLTRFGESHGEATCATSATAVVLTAADGTVADCQVPFPPLRCDPSDRFDPVRELVAHGLVDRTVGVLLVRMGGHAAGVFAGSRLMSSKVGSRQVHGRSAAGGWSQHRFARRREGQVRVALQAAADTVAGVLVPAAATLDAVVLGGDRRAVETVLDDPRLAGLRRLVTEPFLDVPDPRLRILEQTPRQFRAVRVRLLDPPPPDSTELSGP